MVTSRSDDGYHLFHTWEQTVPIVGTDCSRRGNGSFPRSDVIANCL